MCAGSVEGPCIRCIHDAAGDLVDLTETLAVKVLLSKSPEIVSGDHCLIVSTFCTLFGPGGDALGNQQVLMTSQSTVVANTLMCKDAVVVNTYARVACVWKQ
jgi:hypothetical protein